MTDITTWQQGMDYTLRTRYKWKHGSGRGATIINCNHFTEFAGGDYPLVDITRKFLKSYQQDMEDREICNASINRRIAPVTTVLSHLYEEEETDFPPPKVKQYKESQGRPYYFFKDQVEELCDLANPSLSELIRFASCTGGRVIELLAVKAKDIDLNQGNIYFGGRPGFSTKNGDWRVIPIVEQLLPILEKRVIGTHPEIQIFGDEWHNHNRVLRKFKQVTRQINVEPHYVFHCLRHSFATWHVEAGTNLRLLMALMGHRNYKTTLRYAKVTDTARTNAMSSVFN